MVKTIELKWWEVLGKKVGYVGGAFLLLSTISAGWIGFDFPMPASAMSVKQLSRGQAYIGRDLYSDKLRDVIREKQKLEWEMEDTTDNKRKRLLQRFINELDEKIKNLEREENKYEQRIIQMEQSR